MREPMRTALSRRSWLAAGVMSALAACAPPPGPARGTTTAAAAVTLNPPNTFVTLFKWRWNDIATECAQFLGPKGFGAVQISPPEECISADHWWNMYQPVNYRNLVSDMGDAAQLQSMITACHNAGVRVYADAVINHMAGGSGTGLAGTSWNGGTGSGGSWSVQPQFAFFDVNDFHLPCDIQQSDYDDSDRTSVRTCRLGGLPDLNTGASHTQGEIALYLNTLMNMGVDGFRVDAAKHIAPSDLQAIFGQVNANTNLGEARFVTQEIIADGGSFSTRSDYFAIGTINEFQFMYGIRDAFRGSNGHGAGIATEIPGILGGANGGGSYGLVPSANATIFVNNWDTERSAFAADSLNYVEDADGKYDLANIYMLTQPYGRADIESGFAFYHDPNVNHGGSDVNAPSGSPYDSGNAAITTTCDSSHASAACGWDFVHRRGDLAPLVAFRSAAGNLPMVQIVATGNQFSYRRGNIGFVAMNNSTTPWSATLTTGLPAGTYCNVAHSSVLTPGGAPCTGDSVVVNASGVTTTAVSVGALGPGSVPAVVLFTGQQVGNAPPDAPTLNAPAVVSATELDLSWSAAAGASTYTVARSTNGASFTQIAAGVTATTSRTAGSRRARPTRTGSTP
jgi:alpha-amylase